jgi:universal stress protein A
MIASIDGQNRGTVVLVGIDFSPLSEDALRTATVVAERQHDLQLHLVHVVPWRRSDGEERRPAVTTPVDSTGTDIRARLDEFGARLAPRSKVMVHVRVGHPDVQIARLAKDIVADLIVVGAHGQQGLIRSFLAVAQSLVRTAPCPVLTCRSQAILAREQSGTIMPPAPPSARARQPSAGRSGTR